MDANGGRNGLKGASHGRMGFASADPEVEEFIDFSVDKALGERTPIQFLLALTAGSARVAPGTVRAVRCRRVLSRRTVTFNYPTAYWYTRYFKGWMMS